MTSTGDDEPESVRRAPFVPEAALGRSTAAAEEPAHERLVGWLTTYGELAGDALVYSSTYLAVIAMAQVAIVMVLLSLPPNPAPLVVGLVTFSVYVNDRIADAATDSVSNPERATFVNDHREVLYVLAAVAYGLAITLSVLGGPLALAITLLPAVFWVLYASDWVPDVGLRFRRLKELLVVNSVVVALAWAVTLTLLPLAFTGAAFTPAAAAVFAYFFLGTFVNTEIPNVQDVEGDRAIGVATMPIVFGVGRTRRALYSIDLLTVGLLAYVVLTGGLSPVLAVALFVGLAYSLGVTALLGRFDDGRLVTLAAECEYLVVALALVPAIYGL